MEQEQIARALAAMARNSLRLEIAGPAPAETGASRFGGRPDVPAGFVWPVFETATFDDDTVRPRPLAFLAQFRCGDLAPLDRGGLLPETGLLSFFYELGSQRWGFDPRDAGCCRVYWFDGTAALAPADFPAELEADYRLPAMGAAARAESTLPDWDDFSQGRGLEPGDWDRYQAAVAALAPSGDPDIRHRLLGWPDLIQGNMTVECELVRRGVSMGGTAPIPQDALLEAERTSVEDWRLLFQLDTVYREGFELMFGDCGRIYFYIRKEDLAARRFHRAWLIQQCC